MKLSGLAGQSLAAFIGAGAIVVAVTAVEAAILPGPVVGNWTSGVQLAAGGCGAGFHRDIAGTCTPNRIHRRSCQPGFHPESFPNGNGYRCIPN